MTVIDVHFQIDVTVAVDIDEGVVAKVIAWDEELRDVDKPFDEGVTPDQRRKAIEVIAGDTDWPAWQFGT